MVPTANQMLLTSTFQKTSSSSQEAVVVEADELAGAPAVPSEKKLWARVATVG